METEQLKGELNKYQLKAAQEAKNMDFTKELLKFLDTSDYDALRMICAEDWKLYLGSSEEPMSLQDFIPLHKMFYTAFPDYSHTIENIFASRDYVVVKVLLTATHKNEFQGIAPTNKKIAYRGIQIYEFKGDRLNTVHAVDDDLTMMTQLGMELKM